MHEHIDRQAVLDEVHARPVVVVPRTCRIRRLAFLPETPGSGVPQVFGHLVEWCAARGLPEPAEHIRQHTLPRLANGAHRLTWEFHNEFVTLTWSADSGDAEARPDDIGLELVEDLALASAVRIDVIADETLPARLIPTFDLPSLCHATVEDGRAEIASDFTDDAEGFVRFEFAAGGLTDLRRSILVRRLFEIETYAKLTLFGLPPVRAAAPDLSALEAEITACIRQLPDIGGIDSARSAIARLNDLSLRAAALSDRLGYRMAASRAYGGIVEDRLRALKDRSTGFGSSISVYVENRVGPAVRTMAAFEKRIRAAAERIERTALMLNARNGLELEIQNGEILGTISKTARSQFRLQQTVEGLSVIAITYYLLGILGYALNAPLHALDWNKDLAMSILAPIALASVWLASRRLWGHWRD